MILKTLKLIIITIICVFSLTPLNLLAGEKAIQLALFTPVQIFSEDYDIKGVRWNIIYGRNSSVTGLDFGIANHTVGKESVGVQFGLVGIAEAGFTGWHANSVNLVYKEFEGFQFGFVNYSDSVNGFQLGVVNYARKMYGLQIGLINIIKTGGAFPVFPIVNWSF
jgi:hypothetical protein